MLLTFFIILVCCVCTTSALDYPACPSLADQNQGSSYELYGGTRYWSHCNFPSPRFEQRRCGRLPNNYVDYHLCDPDDIFTEEEENEVEISLKQVRLHTPYQCEDIFSKTENFSVAVALVKHIQIPDLSQNNSCMNACGELKPFLDPTTRNATSEEITTALHVFTSGLSKQWNIGSCDNTVAILFWESQTMLGTGPQTRASTIIDQTRISTSHQEALQILQTNNATQVFIYLANKYRVYLIGFSPALIMLSACGAMMLLVLVFLCCQAGRGPALGVFQDSKYDEFTRWLVQLLTCAKFTELLMVTMLHIQTRARPWHFLLPAFLAFVCILVVGVWPAVSKQNEDNSTISNSTF